MSDVLSETAERSEPPRVRRQKADFPPRLRRREAAEYLQEVWVVQVAANTLAKQAVVGDGPRYRKYGPWPYYETDDLDKYAEEKLGTFRRSTSEGR